jgi:hypothetical protein
LAWISFLELRRNLVGINQEIMGDYLLLESLALIKAALLVLHCEVSCYARGTSFLFPETGVLLDEFFESN